MFPVHCLSHRLHQLLLCIFAAALLFPLSTFTETTPEFENSDRADHWNYPSHGSYSPDYSARSPPFIYFVSLARNASPSADEKSTDKMEARAQLRKCTPAIDASRLLRNPTWIRGIVQENRVGGGNKDLKARDPNRLINPRTAVTGSRYPCRLSHELCAALWCTCWLYLWCRLVNHTVLYVVRALWSMGIRDDDSLWI